MRSTMISNTLVVPGCPAQNRFSTRGNRSLTIAALAAAFSIGSLSCSADKGGMEHDDALGFGARGGQRTGGTGATNGTGGAGTADAGSQNWTGGTGGTAGTSLTPGIIPDGGLVGVSGCSVEGIMACFDGIDNDNDGLTDLADTECTGPCDNDEGSFGTGISGDNVDGCKQDCFFDGDSGQGNDGCEWNLKCDPANPGANLPKSCPYNANFKNCPTEQSAKCITNCRAITPNGCDCFGCCAVPAGNMTKTVILSSTCTLDKANDPTACPPCTQQDSCVNTCEPCEICVGKPEPDSSCSEGQMDPNVPPEPECFEGQTSCGPGGDVAADACPERTFCLTGCCVQVVL